jgi:hypothetical protein
MQNITLSAPQDDIEKARRNAERRGTTLNKEFRSWLKTQQKDTTAQADYFSNFMKSSSAKPGRHFSREELNER